MRGVRGAVVALVGAAAVLAAGPAHAVDPRCTTQPAPDPVIARPSWSQAVYDAPARIWPFTRGAGVTVAVVDTGVDPTHPQLAGSVLPGADLVAGSPSGDYDCAPHGTALAGVIAGERLPEVGSAGLAPDATILPVRVTDRPQTGPDAALPAPLLAAALDAAVAAGAQVIAVGVVVRQDDPTLADAVRRALGAGVVVVAPAGDGHSADRDGEGATAGALTPYPAAYDGVLGVGAVVPDGTRTDTSQVGGYVDLVAPGDGVLAPGVGGQRPVGDTAVAAAHVAAAAALLVSAGASVVPTERRAAAVAERLVATASPAPGGAGAYGAGLVDPARALTEQLAAAGPEDLPAQQPPAADPAAEAQAAERERAEFRALVLTLVLGGLVLIVLAVALVVPGARRRRWRSGREREATRPAPDDGPAFLPGEALFQPGSGDRAGSR